MPGFSVLRVRVMEVLAKHPELARSLGLQVGNVLGSDSERGVGAAKRDGDSG